MGMTIHCIKIEIYSRQTELKQKRKVSFVLNTNTWNVDSNVCHLNFDHVVALVEGCRIILVTDQVDIRLKQFYPYQIMSLTHAILFNFIYESRKKSH